MLTEQLDALVENLRKLLRTGQIQRNGRRARPHCRIYTKRYADRRQKRGGELWAAEQERRLAVARPQPGPARPRKPARRFRKTKHHGGPGSARSERARGALGRNAGNQ